MRALAAGSRVQLRFVAMLLCPLLVGAAPRAARAQQVFVHAATMRQGGAIVARVAGAPGTVLRWESARRAVVRVEDAALELELALDLRARDNRVVLPTAEVLWLTGAGRWSIRMLPGAWAPLAGIDGAGRLRVLLPPGMPTASAIVASTIYPTAARPASVAFASMDLAQARGWSSAAEPFVLRPLAGGRARRFPAGSFFRELDPARGWVEVLLGRFVLRGRAVRAPVASSGSGFAGALAGGRGCTRESPARDARRIAPGTALFATPSGAAPVGRTRVELVALAPHDCAVRACAAGDASRWQLMSPSASEPVWLLDVWIHGPLAVAPPPTEGARYCWSTIPGWP
jgi:hypothetical protein